MLTLRRSVQRRKLLATEVRSNLGQVVQLSTQDRDYGKTDYGRYKGKKFSKDKITDKVMNSNMLHYAPAL